MALIKGVDEAIDAIQKVDFIEKCELYFTSL
jgi:hypothetical protein